MAGDHHEALSPPRSWLPALPGLVYALTGIALSWHHTRFHRMRAKLGIQAR